MYSASVPLMQRAITSLAGVLRKGEAFAVAKKIDPSVLLQSRLAPDMFPLVRQVQSVSDSAKGAAARLAGVAVPSYPDEETNFAQLHDRLARTLDFLGGFTPAQIDGSEEREVVLTFRTGNVTFTGYSFLTTFALPNLYFHCTTAYAILRHNGVEIGKRDYLGGN
jgi:uncharacterized protein